MSAAKRTPRDDRRRRLGQNFLRPDHAETLVAGAGVAPGEFVVEIGAGSGACTLALARHGARVLALEKDPYWVNHLRGALGQRGQNVSVVCCDALDYRMPRRAFRALGSLPFGATTAFLRHLLDDPGSSGLWRADLVVQWEVARKRTASPPTTLLSVAWTPWWIFEMGPRIRARAFRPQPAVDAAVLRVIRRTPPLLPERMALAYAEFVRRQWQ